MVNKMSNEDKEIIDHIARAKAEQAIRMLEIYEKHYAEHRASMDRHHDMLNKQIADISQKVSKGIERLHTRMDQADAKRTELITQFSKEIANINAENAKTTTRQSIMWGIGVVVMTGAFSLWVSFFLK